MKKTLVKKSFGYFARFGDLSSPKFIRSGYLRAYAYARTDGHTHGHTRPYTHNHTRTRADTHGHTRTHTDKHNHTRTETRTLPNEENKRGEVKDEEDGEDEAEEEFSDIGSFGCSLNEIKDALKCCLNNGGTLDCFSAYELEK